MDQTKAGTSILIGKAGDLKIYQARFAMTMNGNLKTAVGGRLGFPDRQATWDGEARPALERGWFVAILREGQFSGGSPYYVLRPATEEEVALARANPVSEEEAAGEPETQQPAEGGHPEGEEPAAPSYKKPLPPSPPALVVFQSTYTGKPFVTRGRGHCWRLKKNKKLSEQPQVGEAWVVQVEEKVHTFPRSYDTYQWIVPLRRAEREDFYQHNLRQAGLRIIHLTEFEDNPPQEQEAILQAMLEQHPNLLEEPRTLAYWNAFAHQVATEYGFAPRVKPLSLFYRQEASELHESRKHLRLEHHGDRPLRISLIAGPERLYTSDFAVLSVGWDE